MVGFEGNAGSISQGVQHRIPRRAERDLLSDHDAVDRQNDWLVVVQESDPTNGDPADQTPADVLLEVVVVDDVVLLVERLRCVHRVQY